MQQPTLPTEQWPNEVIIARRKARQTNCYCNGRIPKVGDRIVYLVNPYQGQETPAHILRLTVSSVSKDPGARTVTILEGGYAVLEQCLHEEDFDIPISGF